jgi:thiol-disulfide isomerase/thioredoxin
VALSFGTTWCGPCTILAPELALLADAMEDCGSVTVAKVRGLQRRMFGSTVKRQDLGFRV